MITPAASSIPSARPSQAPGGNSADRSSRASAHSPENANLQSNPNPRNQDGQRSAPAATVPTDPRTALNTPASNTTPASFEFLLNETLLKHTFIETPAVLIPMPRSFKPGSPTAPTPKKSPEPQMNDTAVSVAGKTLNREALPFALNFSLPVASSSASFLGSTGLGSTGGPSTPASANGSGENSAIQSGSDTAPKLTITGESAFTARVQVPDQPSFVVPSAAAPSINPSSVLNSLGLKQSEILKSSAIASVAVEPTNTVLGVVNSPANNTPGVAAPKQSPGPQSVSHIPEVPATPVTPTVPLKEISFQLPGARGVEVKLTETAGQVRVDVRSVDPALTLDLRGNLHDLVSSLERKGLSAEITHPGEGTTMRTNDLNGARNSSSDNHEDAQGRQHEGRGQQDQQRNQQQSSDGRPQKTRATAWNDAIASNLKGSL